VNDVSLRPSRLTDVGAMHRLEREIFPKDYYPHLDLAILLLMPSSVNLKAVDSAGHLLGFIMFGDSWLRWRPAWVNTLGVGTVYQNQGIGGLLLQAVERSCRAQRINLTVRRSNAPAIHLYEKNGYQLVRTHYRYYRDGEDGLIMEKRLT
jgi:ribosomal protein S18 acetylase RimI-like enzyme